MERQCTSAQLCVAGDMSFCWRAADLAPAGGEQRLAGSGAALIRDIKDSAPYNVPQEPRAVTKKYAQARVEDGGWYAWFWPRQARDAGGRSGKTASAQHATRPNWTGGAAIGGDDNHLA